MYFVFFFLQEQKTRGARVFLLLVCEWVGGSVVVENQGLKSTQVSHFSSLRRAWRDLQSAAGARATFSLKSCTQIRNLRSKISYCDSRWWLLVACSLYLAVDSCRHMAHCCVSKTLAASSTLTFFCISFKFHKLQVRIYGTDRQQPSTVPTCEGMKPESPK